MDVKVSPRIRLRLFFTFINYLSCRKCLTRARCRDINTVPKLFISLTLISGFMSRSDFAFKFTNYLKMIKSKQSSCKLCQMYPNRHFHKMPLNRAVQSFGH